ncbi:MAG: hypothetical protein HRF49_04705 [bacterium]|jgi:multimeric flavodoxin WrbA
MKIIGLAACEKLEHSSIKILQYFLIRTTAPFELLTLEGAIDFPDEGQLVHCFGGAEDKVSLGELLDKVAKADALVLSTPVRYQRDGKAAWAYWEKLFAQDAKWKNMLKGKPFVVISMGGLEPMNAFEDAKQFLESQGMDFFGGIVDNGLVDCGSLCTPEFCYVAKVVHTYGLGSEMTVDIGSRIDYEHKDIPDECPARVHTVPQLDEIAGRLGQSLGVTAGGI